MFDLEFIKEKWEKNYRYILASDEVGRGPLAGPVVSSSVYCLMKDNVVLEDALVELLGFLDTLGIKDSKLLTAKNRQKILSKLGINLVLNSKILILENDFFLLQAAIFSVNNEIIDRINILNAALLSMKESAMIFENVSDLCDGIWMIDGNQFPVKNSPNSFTIIKGDQKSKLIGLASILAKEWRDDYMKKMEQDYPGYLFSKHAGYPTKGHKEAVKELGVSPIHRKTFAGVKEHVKK